MSELSSNLITFDFPRTVRWVDADPTGYAHFASYVRMMEETEYAFLRSRGLNVVLRDERGTFGFPRLKSSVEIYEPLVCGQEVIVRLTLLSIDGKKISYRFEMIAGTEKDVSEVAVEGEIVAACCRFPDNELPFAILIPDFVMESLSH